MIGLVVSRLMRVELLACSQADSIEPQKGGRQKGADPAPEGRA